MDLKVKENLKLKRGEMLTLAFLDSGDSTGKSTTCDILVNEIIPKQKFCKATKVVLPNGEGPLGFIRKYVKDKDFPADDFARQLMHCCSQIHEYESLAYGDRISYRGRKYHHYYVFDRGPISTLVYGQALIKNELYLDILKNINFGVLKSLVDKEIIDDIVFFNLDKEIPYRPKDDSYYENVVDFNEIRKLYQEKFELVKEIFSEETQRVKFRTLKVENWTKEEVAQRVWEEIIK